MKPILILLVLLILSVAGCGPAGKLRRAEKLIAKSGLDWKVDTVFQNIMVFVPETRVDSIFKTLPGDTVVLEKGVLKVVYVRLPGDSVFISGTCDSITVIKEVPVTVTKVINAPRSNWWRALLIGAGIGIGLCLVLVFAFRR